MTARVLVTGGAGFIGSHVVDRLLTEGLKPVIFDARPSPWHEPGTVETVIGDLRRAEDVAAAARGCRAILHLAAAADVGEVHQDPSGATELNAMGTLNVLEAARTEGVERVVYASTVWVYSDVDAPVVDEDTPLQAPAHLYTATKLSGELYCRSYRELYDVESTIVRFGIPYGPRARPAAVIPQFVMAAREGRGLSIAGDGSQQRSFVYVEDLADGMVRALAPAAADRVYNLGSDETTTIRELADLVCEVVAPTEITHTPGRTGDLAGSVISSERAERELGWRAATPLREGVRRYAAWLEEAEQREPVTTAATTPAVAKPAHPRLAHRLAALLEPMAIGLAGGVATISAAAAEMLHGLDVSESWGATVLTVALLLPIWSLAITAWPEALRRTQTALAGGLGVTSVGVITALSPDAFSDLGRARAVLVLALSLSATAALQWLPRRLAGNET